SLDAPHQVVRKSSTEKGRASVPRHRSPGRRSWSPTRNFPGTAFWLGVVAQPSRCSNYHHASMISRRSLLLGAVGQSIRRQPQRVVVVMCDGFGVDYFTASSMPTLARWKSEGLYKSVRGVMPSVTNANNASICCGMWPAVHGITGNSYWDARAGREEYMESAALLRAPTLFERAARSGTRSALLWSKKRTVSRLRRGADVAWTAE